MLVFKGGGSFQIFVSQWCVPEVTLGAAYRMSRQKSHNVVTLQVPEIRSTQTPGMI